MARILDWRVRTKPELFMTTIVPRLEPVSEAPGLAKLPCIRCQSKLCVAWSQISIAFMLINLEVGLKDSNLLSRTSVTWSAEPGPTTGSGLPRLQRDPALVPADLQVRRRNRKLRFEVILRCYFKFSLFQRRRNFVASDLVPNSYHPSSYFCPNSKKHFCYYQMVQVHEKILTWYCNLIES